MHPLAILGTLAAGAVVVSKIKGPTPDPAVNPAITQAATGLARRRMADGASPEEAAAWAARKVANSGGGFWDSESRNALARRF